MSSAKGSRLFASDRKSIVRMLTILLFSLGIAAASLFAYQQLARQPIPDVISEKEAIQLTLVEGNWDQQPDNRSIDARLLHVKNDGFTFAVDKETLQDAPAVIDRMQGTYSNHYIWKVKITSDNSNYEWESWIDAETGGIMLSSANGRVISK